MIEILQGYDRAPIVTLEIDDASALESKLSAAARLFTDRKSWQEPFERIAILHRLSVLLEGKREHFGLQIAREGGKPLTDALIEVDRAIDGVRNAADMLRVAAGQEIPMGLTGASVDRRAFTIRKPIGVRLSNRGR
jgi:acyl-CoA reductase-like NAD-dependent aldehyde dehydrogenase